MRVEVVERIGKLFNIRDHNMGYLKPSTVSLEDIIVYLNRHNIQLKEWEEKELRDLYPEMIIGLEKIYKACCAE